MIISALQGNDTELLFYICACFDGWVLLGRGKMCKGSQWPQDPVRGNMAKDGRRDAPQGAAFRLCFGNCFIKSLTAYYLQKRISAPLGKVIEERDFCSPHLSHCTVLLELLSFTRGPCTPEAADGSQGL